MDPWPHERVWVAGLCRRRARVWRLPRRAGWEASLFRVGPRALRAAQRQFVRGAAARVRCLRRATERRLNWGLLAELRARFVRRVALLVWADSGLRRLVDSDRWVLPPHGLWTA